MKKILIILVSILALLVLIIAMIPLFVSVDNFRPQIQKQLEAKLRGRVELGKLSLHTFPAITLGIDGVNAFAPAPFDKEKLAEIKKIEVKIPLYALLVAPRLSILINEPVIRLVNAQNKSNLSEFLPSPEQAAANEKATAPAKDSSGAPGGDPLAGLPSFLRARIEAAKISLILEKALVSIYTLGAEKKEHTTVKDLDLSFSNIGFHSPMQISLKTILDYAAPNLVARGPISVDGDLTLTPQGAEYLMDFNLNNDLSALDITMGSLFAKAKGVALSVHTKGHLRKYDDMDAELESFVFRFADLEVQSKLKAIKALSESESNINFEVSSNKLNLASLEKFVPMVAAYKLKGNFSLAGKAHGSMKNPNFDFALNLENVAGQTPQLAIPLADLDGKIQISGNLENPLINVNPFKMKMGSSDLNLKALLKGIEAPDLNLEISSNRFNVDEMLGTQSSAAAQKTATQNTSASTTPEPTNSAPLDDTLDKMAPELEKSLANPMLDKIKANVKISAHSMRMVEGEFKNAKLNLDYKSRLLTVSNTGIDAYKGNLLLQAKFGLNPKAPSYEISSKLQNVSIGEAIKVHMPSWKNELSGNLNGQFNLSGKGLRKKQLEENLRGGLNGDLKNGRTSIPVVKLISGVLEKLPKKVQNPAADKAKDQVFNGEFKTMLLNTTIVGRVVKIDKTDIAFAAEKSGLGEIKFLGNGSVTFDRMMDFTGTAFLSPSVVPIKELKGPSGQIEIPLKFKGPMDNPSPDIGYSVGILAPRMLKNFAQSDEGKKVINKASDELQKQIQKQNLPAPAQKAIDDLRKKFKF